MALLVAYGCSNGDVMRFTKHGICMAGVLGLERNDHIWMAWLRLALAAEYFCFGVGH